jgi:branched-chain amino acid transport system ATP-binding protein
LPNELLKIFGLERRANDLAKNLPYGDQRRLEIARALATKPNVLLLDEPAAGLNTGETMQLMDKIHEIRDRFGLTILLIEHNMELVMGICERILVLNYGKTIAEGPPEKIQNDPVVIEAYLGEPAEV